MSKTIYGILGILVIVVVILTGFVGYLYSKQANTITQTLPTTSAETYTSTKTSSQTFTKTETQTSTTTIAITTTTIPTLFEKIEISSAWADDTVTVIINVKNTGSIDATITDIFLNGKPLCSCALDPTTPISLKVGQNTEILLTLTNPLASGTVADIKIHTASGNDYPKAVIVP